MQPEGYPIPAAAARTEIWARNSRFIGSATYTPTVEAAKAFLAEVRAAYPTATHHAFAYLVGYGNTSIAGLSDAGEPPGTAGRPMLAVVQGSGLGDITVVGTRYFGGTLLGTGGLVRAYSAATKAVLELLPRAVKVAQTTILISLDYNFYAMARQMLMQSGATIMEEDFTTEIQLLVKLPAPKLTECKAKLAEMTGGKIEVVEV